MRYLWVVATISSSLFLSGAQGQSPKRGVSSQPLTAERIAVYRAVIKEYMKHAGGGMNVANQTEPLRSLDYACTKGIALEGSPGQVPTVHSLNAMVEAEPSIILVDSDRQNTQIKESDQQTLMKKAIDGHEEITDQQIEKSVKKAVETGLFTLSEIVFDKQHRRAVVSYSFVCGGLCGNGSTLILTKVGKEWRVSKRCSVWAS